MVDFASQPMASQDGFGASGFDEGNDDWMAAQPAVQMNSQLDNNNDFSNFSQPSGGIQMMG